MHSCWVFIAKSAAPSWSSSKKKDGHKIIAHLAINLKKEFPDMWGFSVRNIKYMQAFAEAYPYFTIVQPSLAQLGSVENEQSEFVQGALALFHDFASILEGEYFKKHAWR